jgi:hypothetical protein
MHCCRHCCRHRRWIRPTAVTVSLVLGLLRVLLVELACHWSALAEPSGL